MLRAEVAPRPRPPRSAAGVDWSGQAPAGGAARDLRRPAMVRGRPRTRCLGRRRWTRRLGRGILTIGSHAEVATASAGNEFMVCVMICV